MQEIYVQGALKPAGHYAPAVTMGDYIFISGQLPIDPLTGEKCGRTLAEQAKKVFENFSAVLDAAGVSKDQVVKTTLFIPDVAFWKDINGLYAMYFGDHHPSRSIVPTRELHHGCLLEMEGIACKSTGSKEKV